jgi:hypothetical protein
MRPLQKPLAFPHLWLPNVPPRNGLTVTAFFALILILTTANIAVQQPYPFSERFFIVSSIKVEGGTPCSSAEISFLFSF